VLQYDIRIETFEIDQGVSALKIDSAILLHNLAIAARHYCNELLVASRSPNSNANQRVNLKHEASKAIQGAYQFSAQSYASLCRDLTMINQNPKQTKQGMYFERISLVAMLTLHNLVQVCRQNKPQKSERYQDYLQKMVAKIRAQTKHTALLSRRENPAATAA
jgi:hypothetical protein